jgi:IS30 family transposase
MGEREQLAGFLAMNMRIRAIATVMKRQPSTIARERSRGTIDCVYSATGAATAAKTRRKNSGAKGRYSFSMAMNISGLLRCTWSPEQIDGYCWLHGIPMASIKTIYRWL